MMNLLFPRRNPAQAPLLPTGQRHEPYSSVPAAGCPRSCTLRRLAIVTCTASVALTVAGSTVIALMAKSDLPNNAKIGAFVAGGVALLAGCYCFKIACVAKISDKNFEKMYEHDPQFVKNFLKLGERLKNAAPGETFLSIAESTMSSTT